MFYNDYSSNPKQRIEIGELKNRRHDEYKFKNKISVLENKIKLQTETLDKIKKIWSNFAHENNKTAQ